MVVHVMIFLSHVVSFDAHELREQIIFMLCIQGVLWCLSGV